MVWALTLVALTFWLKSHSKMFPLTRRRSGYDKTQRVFIKVPLRLLLIAAPPRKSVRLYVAPQSFKTFFSSALGIDAVKSQEFLV